MDRNAVNSIGHLLAGLRGSEENALSVTFTAHAPSIDCRDGSMSVTIRTPQDCQTSEAVYLYDAIYMVRGKLKRAAEKRAAEKAEEKAAANA